MGGRKIDSMFCKSKSFVWRRTRFLVWHSKRLFYYTIFTYNNTKDIDTRTFVRFLSSINSKINTKIGSNL